MRTMLRCAVLVALIATIKCSTVVCNVREYSENALKNLQLTDADSSASKAELVNPDTEIEFVERENPEEDAVYMVPTSAPQDGPGPCANTIGIKLTETGDVFCNISVLGLEVDYLDDNEQNIQLALLFNSESEGEKTSLLLDVPIFIQPAQFASDDKQKEFNNWASDKKLGVEFPIEQEKLSVLCSKKPVKLGFKWLRDLLRHGIFESRNPFALEAPEGAKTASYVSYPVVVPKEYAQEFLDTVITLRDDLYIDLN